MAEETKIGTVKHFFDKIGVALLSLTDGDLAIGDTIRIKGHTTDITAVVDSMQVDRQPVNSATKGQEAGTKITGKARIGDSVFKVTA